MALMFRFPGVSRTHCLFTGRKDGNLSFRRGDREQVERARAALPNLVECHQVHGLELALDVKGDHDSNYQADGMATSEAHLALLIKTADCQPLLFTHKSGAFIMALHVGWRGNRNNFIQLAVSRFCDHYGLRSADLLVVRGPSLGPASAEFVNFEAEWGDEFRPWFNESSRTMDLWALTRWQLEQTGIRRIYSIDICTAMNNEFYFSWRRDKSQGRQGALIWRD